MAIPERGECELWLLQRLSHRLSRESYFHEVTVFVNCHAVLVYVARFQINFVAAYPATIRALGLGH
jgi:hypothetical protein